MTWKVDSELHFARLSEALLYHEAGKVTKSVGMVFEANLPGASVGSICRVQALPGYPPMEAEVIGFRDRRVILMPFDDSAGVNNDSRVILHRRTSSVRVSRGLLGRILNAKGEPIDGKGPIQHEGEISVRGLYDKPSHPLERSLIREPVELGVRAIDGLLTVGKGQRVGIMAGSGVGKSVLLGMMSRHTSADINVIALIGERGREVREFIERDLGAGGLARSVVIVATSDQSPLLRMRGAFLAATVAEHFRDEGSDVLLLMDSVTRFCMAQREIGLSMGEPPASKGYTPSVFSTLPKLLERSGTGIGKGSITGLFTVLVEGDDMDDPIADSARSILDGHFVLSRKIAQRNHFPALDVLQSTSRVFRSITTESHQQWAGKIREWLSLYNQAEDLINIGAYAKGANVKVDQAVAVIDRIQALLRQGVEEKSTFSETQAMMHSICRAAESAALASEQGRK